MSSHREAPEISQDPVADNTDVYAFVSPDKPDTVTLIANFIPLQKPDGGPNFWEFGEDVTYRIHICNSGDAKADITYEFNFSTRIVNPETFLYNTGPITHISDKTWNRPQTYSVARLTRSRSSHGDDDASDADNYRGGGGHRGNTANRKILGENLTCPPVNVGPRSTPNYPALAAEAIHDLPGGRTVFAGQRAEAFFVDVASIFDLGALRPLQMAHLIPSAAAVGVNGLQGLNVHSIALQVPITDLTRGGVTPGGVADPAAVIGVYASASRRRAQFLNSDGHKRVSGPYVQVSRLANPLFNEVLIPMAKKDYWNRVSPSQDSEFASYVLKPELAALLPALYPGAFPRLAAYTKPRADLAAILLTGIPTGVVDGFQNFTGTTQADLLRLNVAIPPTAEPNSLGVVGGDLAGFPNGRRVADDVVTIELKAVAGATLPLVDPTFTPDDVVPAVADGTTNTNATADNPLLKVFPYLAHPFGGYQTGQVTPNANPLQPV
ncbi:MAG: DUF4331 domain-containing protein [Nakamurella sp.]